MRALHPCSPLGCLRIRFNPNPVWQKEDHPESSLAMDFLTQAAGAAQSDGEAQGGEFGIPVGDIHLEGPEIGL